jgi:hypothetical protein
VVKFDDAAVRALKRAMANASANGHPFQAMTRSAEPAPAASTLAAVLSFVQIEADKRDVLVKLAQRYSAQDLAILLEL